MSKDRKVPNLLHNQATFDCFGCIWYIYPDTKAIGMQDETGMFGVLILKRQHTLNRFSVNRRVQSLLISLISLNILIIFNRAGVVRFGRGRGRPCADQAG